MKVRYVNHKGKELDFMSLPYLYQVGNLLDYTWSYESGDGIKSRVQNLRRADVNIPITVSVVSDDAEKFKKAAYDLFEIPEADVLAEKPGKLYVNDYYLKCYVVQDIPADWNLGVPFMKRTMYILPDYPFWCREVTKSFLKGNPVSVQSAEEYLSYPFGYAYQYSVPRDAAFLENDHYSPCDFQMIVYGPCENPAIRISGHPYEVAVTLYAGDYLKVDSRDHTVIQCKPDGRQINLFNQRRKDSNLFEKIQPGRSAVSWTTGAFGFDLTLFQERSEPKWIL